MILDNIHSDLWRPARVKSKGGARYFMSMIDYHSQKVWVTILLSKDQALQAFEYILFEKSLQEVKSKWRR